MKFGAIRLLPSHFGMAVAFIYGYGALLGVFSLVWSWIAGRDISHLAWWQYLMAPLAIGLSALVLEALGTFLSNGFSIEPANSARRAAGSVALVAAVLLVVIGWPIYQMSRS